ncbi:hypothetical protein P7C73_g793, partial [Tremellales sp. Uapishka_1]
MQARYTGVQSSAPQRQSTGSSSTSPYDNYIVHDNQYGLDATQIDTLAGQTSAYISSNLTALVPSQPAATGGRPPRSRKQRPCDPCRRGKNRCTITASGPPCAQCTETKKQCTFDLAPPPRKVPVRPIDDAEEAGPSPSRSKRTRSPSYETYRKRNDYGTMESPSPSRRSSGEAPEMSGLDVLAAAVPSFDHLADADYEPHEIERQLTSDLRPPTQGLTTLSQLRSLLTHHPSRISETSLIEAYTLHVHPALPVLPKGDPGKLPPQLLSAVLATALNHQVATRPLAPLASVMISTSSSAHVEHNLASVAASVLELEMRPSDRSQGAYLLLAKTIALAQLLGMHLNPHKWSIPPWEKELRIRLWWTLVIHDAWMSFLNSSPSHIQANNSSVPLPSLSAVLVASCVYSSASSDSSKSFIASCRLARLVCRLQAEVCTLGALSTHSSGERRQEVSEILELADAMLVEWKSASTGSAPRPTGRIQTELEHGFGSTFDPTPEMLLPFSDLVDFVTRLQLSDLDGYFLKCELEVRLDLLTSDASHILSSVMSSLIRLTLASPSTPSPEALDLIARFTRALSQQQSKSQWDVAASALRRAAAVSERLKSVNEHQELCSVLKPGSTPETVEDPIAEMLNLSQLETVEPQLLWDWSGVDWLMGDQTFGAT